MLKDSAVYSKIILSVVPGIAVCTTALSALIFGVISFVSVTVSWILVYLLKGFLNKKTVPFVCVVISLGVIGILTMVASLFFKAELEGVSHYLPLLAVTTALLLPQENMFASLKTAFTNSLVQGASGSAFLFVSVVLKEVLGKGSIFGFDIYTKIFPAAEFFATAAGGLLIAAGLTVVYNLIVKYSEKRGAK